ncbi:hypothetical protein [Sediminibacillus massiliensis]|uniref:hypothetical protein n=1 Tax=Sediminibacillus massiliensis TaxID=1926277 RepID=UPI0015C33735|nr:hypothetical protein [Sediminibacillus massiliensis]
MIIIAGSMAATLITMAILEDRGKISINPWVSNGVLLVACAGGIWYVFTKVGSTFNLF